MFDNFLGVIFRQKDHDTSDFLTSSIRIFGFTFLGGMLYNFLKSFHLELVGLIQDCVMKEPEVLHTHGQGNFGCDEGCEDTRDQVHAVIVQDHAI